MTNYSCSAFYGTEFTMKGTEPTEPSFIVTLRTDNKCIYERIVHEIEFCKELEKSIESEVRKREQRRN